MKLPTIQAGKYIDNEKVSNVVKFVKNGITYLLAIIDKEPVWLICTPELEQWFFDSNICISDTTGEVIYSEKVENIPAKNSNEDKSKNHPKPK